MKRSKSYPVLQTVMIAFLLAVCLTACDPGPHPGLPEEPQTSFPADAFRKFLDERFIPVEIPSPVATGEWYVGPVHEDDGEGEWLLAEVEVPNQGEIGVDSMEDIYRTRLQADGWIVDVYDDPDVPGDDYGYVAVKEDVRLRFYSSFYIYEDTPHSEFTIIIYARERLIPVYAEDFSISGRSSVMVGRTTLLDIVTEPRLANQRTCEWSSSDDGTATVENGVVKGLSTGSVTISAKLRNEAGEYLVRTFDLDVVENTPSRWTVMVYMCGSDLESNGQMASKDIDEMLGVPGQPEDINIVIQTGGASEWKNTLADPDHLCRFHIEDGNLVPDDRLENASMGDPGTLADFMTWGMTFYPAEKTALILWGHGSGMGGVCPDELFFDDSLENSEIGQAFSAVFDRLGLEDRLEFIGYDACMMQYQDAAGIDSEYFRYMVGSEEVSSGLGWDYAEWMDDLYAGSDTVTILKEIASGYNEAFGKAENFPYIIGWDRIQTQSVLDLTRFGAYRDSFEALAEALAAMPGSDAGRIRELLKTVKRYGIDMEVDASDYPRYLESGYREEWFLDGTDIWGDPVHILPSYCEYALFDAKDFLDKLDGEGDYDALDDRISAARTALEAMIVCNETGENSGNSCGLALYCPVVEITPYIEKETVFTVWRNLVKMDDGH